MSSRDRDAAQPLTIAVVNNASAAAFAATQRRYRVLLERAAGGRDIRVLAATLPGTGAGAATDASCLSLRALMTMDVDGLVVTGAEPTTADLHDEPFWEGFTALMRWAEQEAIPRVLSCLAAQAAVLHAHGVRRVRLGEKRFGVFDHEVDCGHGLTVGLPAHYRAPHSRWNELPETVLRRAGYRILSRSSEAGVDAFVQDGAGLALHLQGHLEYGPRTLLSEYQRDLNRFACGESACAPSAPTGCDALGAEGVPTGSPRRPSASWTPVAAGLFGNWLDHVAQDRLQRRARGWLSAFFVSELPVRRSA